MGIKSSENAQHFVGQPGFTRLIANHDKGDIPEKGPAGAATLIRTTWTSDHPVEGGRRPFQGLTASSVGADPRPVGVLTVADNDFTTGPASFYIGDYEFRAGVDFPVGALAGNTASNIAAAIQNNGLAGQGWSAVAVGADVTIRYPHPGKVRFEAQHNGTIVNFTLSTVTGFLTYGGTQPSAPTLT